MKQLEFNDVLIKQKVFVGIEKGIKIFSFSVNCICKGKTKTGFNETDAYSEAIKMWHSLKKGSYPKIKLYEGEVTELTHITIKKEVKWKKQKR